MFDYVCWVFGYIIDVNMLFIDVGLDSMYFMELFCFIEICFDVLLSLIVAFDYLIIISLLKFIYKMIFW